MDLRQHVCPDSTRMPPVWVGIVVGLSVLPFLLHLLGVDFGTQSIPLTAVGAGVSLDTLLQTLRGSFTHTLLEWTAFCLAFFTVVLACIHFHVQRDSVTPVIGVALFCAGTIDALHTLMANRLIAGAADHRDLIPVTWALCRLLNVLIMLVGVGVVLGLKKDKWHSKTSGVVGVSLVFGALAYSLMHWLAVSTRLPQTLFPDAWITRPYDVVPLGLFLVVGMWVYPRLWRREPSLFSHALVLSVIPEVMTQLHMAFGSTALFDAHFNIAHALRILAYLVPGSGLVLDYIRTYRDKAQVVAQLEAAHTAMEERSEQLLVFPTALLDPGPDKAPVMQHASQERRRLHILLAEDNIVNQKVALRILEKRGYTVTLATHGKEALRILQEQHCDLVLMDVHMPVRDGLEATAAIRAREQTQGGHIPIVALTANAMQSDKRNCLDAGMDGYIAKPFKASEVIAMIETLVPQEPEDELSCMEDAPPVAAGSDAEHGAGVTLDWQDGLERVDGDEELYNDILAVFCGDAHMTIINAGQPPVVYLPQNGDPRLIELGGDVLGAFPQVCHEQLDVPVEEGDRFFLYSDGLIERPGKCQTWPQRLPELLACCSQMHHGSITDAATRLTTLIQEPGEQPEDDVVVLGIEV